MSESSGPTRTETILYDADGNRTEDESVAVPKSLEGDLGELATRPRHESS